jgi:hypothetical protein
MMGPPLLGPIMPWLECTVMDSRREFIMLATQEGANIRELCRRFAISPKTGYTWIRRYAEEGEAELADRARRPHSSPQATLPPVIDLVGDVRRAHPWWGGRKLHHHPRRHHCPGVPAPSTITHILDDADPLRADPDRTATGRFERETPNALWQLDFMGHRPLRRGRVHPLTLLDDHSRYLLTLTATGQPDSAGQPSLSAHRFFRRGTPPTSAAQRHDPGRGWSRRRLAGTGRDGRGGDLLRPGQGGAAGAHRRRSGGGLGTGWGAAGGDPVRIRRRHHRGGRSRR